jgi:hypothetical protein
MYPEISPAVMTLAVEGPRVLPVLEPLDPDYFEELSAAEAVTLLAGRFHAFSERGWGWKEALLLAVRADQRSRRPASVPRLGDVSAA